jgi:hypothetical protein
MEYLLSLPWLVFFLVRAGELLWEVCKTAIVIRLTAPAPASPIPGKLPTLPRLTAA